MTSSFRVGEWDVEPDRNRLTCEGREVKVQPRVMDLLRYLAQHPGTVVDKNALIDHVWEGAAVSDEALTYSVSELRRALGDDSRRPRYVETVPKRGYRLIAAVTQTAIDASADSPPARKLEPFWLLVAAIAALSILAFLVLRRTPKPPTGRFERITAEAGRELFPSLSPDGNSLVYVSMADGDWDIYLRRIGGQTDLNLTEDSDLADSQPSFSPDGDHIAFRSERDGGGLFLMGASGESVRRLTDFGYNPAWSPDGGEIVFATESIGDPFGRFSTSELWAIVVATGQLRKIRSEDAVQPAWSPSGSRIAFWTVLGGNRDIWTIPASGGDAVAVTVDAFVDWSPVWSPQGDSIYFSSDRGGAMSLWRIRLDPATGEPRGEPEPITRGGSASHFQATISGASDRLAFVDETGTSNLWKVAFDPVALETVGEPEPITRGSRLWIGSHPSPTGAELATQSGGAQEDIYLVQDDGSSFRQLTDDPFKDRLPRWSSDGAEIVFYTNRAGSYELWAIRPDGSGSRQVTRTPNENVLNPTWSPDGKHIAYYNNDTKRSYIVAAGGEAPPRALPALDSGFPFKAYAWSPDGRWIAGDLSTDFTTTGETGGIAVYSTETGAYRMLSDSGRAPRWLPGSRYLVYTEHFSIHLLDCETGKTKRLLEAAGGLLSAPEVSGDGTVLYFTREEYESDVWLLSLE